MMVAPKQDRGRGQGGGKPSPYPIRASRVGCHFVVGYGPGLPPPWFWLGTLRWSPWFWLGMLRWSPWG